VPIEFLPIDDGVRESDVEFQKSIDILIQQFLRQHNLPYMMVHGTPQERCDQIIQVLMVN
jgi:hypothetical protein